MTVNFYSTNDLPRVFSITRLNDYIMVTCPYRGSTECTYFEGPHRSQEAFDWCAENHPNIPVNVNI